jgi:hypothetical protein
MKIIKLFVILMLPFIIACNQKDTNLSEYVQHVVLFKLQDSTSSKTLEQIKQFTEPLAKIEVVKDFDFGVNSSPEGLDKGFNYSLIMKFATEHDRDSVYLSHPIHVEFVDSISKHISDVIVFDLAN